MNFAVEFVRDIRHCAEPWTWNLLQEDGEITYSPDRDARTGWIRYKCKTDKAFTEVLKPSSTAAAASAATTGTPGASGSRASSTAKRTAKPLLLPPTTDTSGFEQHPPRCAGAF